MASVSGKRGCADDDELREPLPLFLRQPGALLDNNRYWQLAPRRSPDHPMLTSARPWKTVADPLLGATHDLLP